MGHQSDHLLTHHALYRCVNKYEDAAVPLQNLGIPQEWEKKFEEVESAKYLGVTIWTTCTFWVLNPHQ